MFNLYVPINNLYKRINLSYFKMIYATNVSHLLNATEIDKISKFTFNVAEKNNEILRLYNQRRN